MTISWTGAPHQAQTCPVCAAGNATEVLVYAAPDGQNTRYFRCDNCACVYPDHFDNADDSVGGYQIGRADRDLGLKHYVEVGAGIGSLLEPLLRVKPSPEGSLLDVGCGFGYVVAAWEQIGAGKTTAHGIELASYGHYGRELLGIDISHELLDRNAQVAGRQFDVIYSSEVIEHVPDALAFLKDIRSFMTADGMLVLTTPNADAIGQDLNVPVLLAALSPGFHQFLLSAKQLRSIIQQAGFAHCVIEEKGCTLVAWASPSRAITLPSPDAAIVDAAQQKVYAGLAKSGNDWVRGGALYRQFRFTVDHGDYAAAVAIDAELRACVESQLGPESGWGEWARSTLPTMQDMDAMVGSMPCYFGHYLYYRGMLQLNHHGDLTAAAHALRLSLEINRAWFERLPSLAQEAAALLPTCSFHLDMVLSRLAQWSAQQIGFVENANPDEARKFTARRPGEIVWPSARQIGGQLNPSPVRPGRWSRMARKLRGKG